MGSGMQKKIASANKANTGVLERMNNAEKNIQMIFENAQKNFGVIDQKFGEQAEILDACVTLLGLDTVFEQVKKARIDKAETEAESKRVALEKAIVEGTVVAAESVGPQSIIIGSEVDKDGNQLHPLRAQILFAQIKADLAEPLKDKKVGDVIVTPMETKFTINEIYDIVLPDPAATIPAVVEEVPSTVESEPLDLATQQSLVEELSAVDGTVN